VGRPESSGVNDTMVQVRGYQPGDEEGIVKVINSSFHGFPTWGLTTERWLEYEADPGFRRENALVAVDRGSVIGSLQLVYRELNVYGAYVKVAGVANVCTDPAARGMGVASTLMKEVMARARRIAPLAALYTDYSSGAHRIYRRVGFAPLHFFRWFSGESWDMAPELELLKREADVAEGVEGVRIFEHGDEAWIQEVYARSSERVGGSARRSSEYWTEKLFKRNSWHTFFFRDFEPKDVLVLPGRAYAYLDTSDKLKGHLPFELHRGEGRRLIVREAVSLPSDEQALASILLASIGSCRDCDEYVVPGPEGSGNLDRLLSRFYTFRGGDSYMFKLLDLAGLVEDLKLPQPEEKLSLEVYDDSGERQAVVLGRDGKVLPEAPSMPDLRLHSIYLMRVLFGLTDPASLLQTGLVEAKSRASVRWFIALKEKAPTNFHTWMSDSWRRQGVDYPTLTERGLRPQVPDKIKSRRNARPCRASGRGKICC